MRGTEQRVYGPITVERRTGMGDYHAYLTASDPRIGTIGRNLYEAIGDLVAHHPERFALQMQAVDGAQHSDAPWRFEPNTDRKDGTLNGWIVPCSAGEDDPCVAYVEGVGGTDLARMLAAPELLAGALEMKCWGCSTFVYLEKLPQAPWCGQCAPIRAAVAKAKGQQP